MTVDERLAEWLEQTTPEPPRAVTVEDVERRVTPRRRTWAPLLAAACVLAIAAVAVLVATRGTKHDAAPPSRPTATRTTPPPHTSTHPHPAPAPNAALPVTPWGARVVANDLGLIGGVLVGHGSSLYATGYVGGGHSAIERIDSATGLVRARFDTHAALSGDPVFVDGSLWLTLTGRRSGHLQAFDPIRLTPRRRLPSTPIGRGPSIQVASAGRTIFVASGHVVTAFDTRTGAVTDRYRVPGHLVSAVAVHGGHLFVGTGAGAGAGELDTFDVTSGSLLDTNPNAGSVFAITATDGGLWVSTSSGMSAPINFNGRFVQPGGGGVRPTIGVYGNTAWLGGTGYVQCADPNTGVVRAHAPLTVGGKQVFVFDIVVAARRVLAWATGNGAQYLVELHPPKTCG